MKPKSLVIGPMIGNRDESRRPITRWRRLRFSESELDLLEQLGHSRLVARYHGTLELDEEPPRSKERTSHFAARDHVRHLQMPDRRLGRPGSFLRETSPVGRTTARTSA